MKLRHLTLFLVLTLVAFGGCGEVGGDTGGTIPSEISVGTGITLQTYEEEVGAKPRQPTAQDIAEMNAGKVQYHEPSSGETAYIWRVDNGQSWLILYVDAGGRVNEAKGFKKSLD